MGTRDLADPPVAVGSVAADGTFVIPLDDSVERVWLALWPQQGAAYPVLLRETAFLAPFATDLRIAMPGPPRHREERHALGNPAGWGVAFGLLLALALIVFGGRAWLLRPGPVTDRWIPSIAPKHGAGWPLLAILSGAAGLLLWGTLALNEALDLLEYTYFQEAFSGTNPLAVALSPVVAERAHAPGYALFLWALRHIRADAWFLRLPAVLAALGGIWAVFRLTAEAADDRRAGWLAAALAAMSPLAMRYGRDLTPYSLVGLLAVLSTLLLYRALASGEKRWWRRYALVSTAAFFLHYFTAFLLLGQAMAGLWLLFRGGRGPEWRSRARDALWYFGAAGILPLLWSGQVIRAFVISKDDNLVTHAVYPVAPDFLTYVLNHLRVLFGVPVEVSWLVWPLLALVIVGYRYLLRDKPAFGRLLLIPFLMVSGLLLTTYALHSYAYGGRIYYGWRWLRPYVAAVVIPVAWLPFALHGRARWAAGAGVVVMLTASMIAGGRTALRYERPAARDAASIIRTHAQTGDAIGVLPSPFYTVGLGFYLHDQNLQRTHLGPTNWEPYAKDGDYVRMFGPIRTFGIPLESLIGHVDVQRLWVVDYQEVLFGQPEFDTELPAQTLESLASRGEPRIWRMPHLNLYLFPSPPVQPWPGEVTVSVRALHRSLRWLPDSLEPDRLFEILRGERPLRIRVPSAVGDMKLVVSLHGQPSDATPQDLRVEEKVGPSRFDVTVHRSERALSWPLVVTISQQ